MPDETRVWPHAACKAGNLAPASAIMILPFKVCEAHGSWLWEGPHPGSWLCLQVPGLRVARPERTSAAMTASCRSHVAAQAGNQARGGSRQAALQGTSNRSGTAGQSALHRTAIIAPADARHTEQAAPMATEVARFAQGPASRRESRPDGIRNAEVPGTRRVQDAKIAFAIVQLSKRGI